jgi:hypothetical protein
MWNCEKRRKRHGHLSSERQTFSSRITRISIGGAFFSLVQYAGSKLKVVKMF